MQKYATKFYCEKCDYGCSRKFLFEQHLKTKKHNGNKMIINFREKFLFRRGRINCSLNDNEGWRWLGTQFTIKEKN